MKAFRAIKSANIDLNGITVLAGENGSGKSTLTRTLFYLIDAISNYERYVFANYKGQMRRLFRQLEMAVREVSMFSRGIESFELQKYFSKLDFDNRTLNEVDEIKYMCRDVVIRCAGVLEKYFHSHANQRLRIARLLTYISMDPDKPFDSQAFIASYMAMVQQIYDEFQGKLLRRDINALFELINTKYEIRLSPENVQISENDVNVFGTKQVGNLFNIQRAIYVDTPMALCNEVDDNPLWEYFNSLISQKRSVELSTSQKKMKLYIQRIMHGSVEMKEDIFDDELHYIREDNLDIPITQAATGIRSFAYILRLLENGFLDDSTLLIIDEPEAHLHPQWVVEFARVLVLLNKELGVKILIASHNPDMVAAIQTIATTEGLLDDITFYQAIASDDFTYTYKNCGSEIGDIFNSFNIALDRIQYYGNGKVGN